jgi:hypothetical protein
VWWGCKGKIAARQTSIFPQAFNNHQAPLEAVCATVTGAVDQVLLYVSADGSSGAVGLKQSQSFTPPRPVLAQSSRK